MSAGHAAQKSSGFWERPNKGLIFFLYTSYNSYRQSINIPNCSDYLRGCVAVPIHRQG